MSVEKKVCWVLVRGRLVVFVKSPAEPTPCQVANFVSQLLFYSVASLFFYRASIVPVSWLTASWHCLLLDSYVFLSCPFASYLPFDWLAVSLTNFKSVSQLQLAPRLPFLAVWRLALAGFQPQLVSSSLPSLTKHRQNEKDF